MEKQQPMLNKFRTRYPQGSLISELIEIDRAQYIVKASVQVNGITLASGMAAAETVELAEDRARVRALAILGLDVVASTAVVEPTITKVETEQKTYQGSKPEPNLNSTPNNNSVLNLVPPQPTVTEAKKNIADNIPNITQNTVADLPSVNKSEPENIPQTNGIPPQEELNIQSNYQPSEPEIDIPPPEEEETDGNIHIDDVIKETNIQMKRLGWTSEQGRNYLIQTYGKRSRHTLTDEELWDFLEYLKAQP